VSRRERARVETSVTCAECGTSTIVPFKPRQDRPVLCRWCLDQKRPMENNPAPACAGTA
jgi:CxxC-x17-CxxC domain-containing protein